jgi:hypothetical protein
MYSLLETTKRRLQKLPQINSVWEGDRRSLTGVNSDLEPDVDANGECIIWVDGSEGFVRAMDVVSPEMGLEAVVRTLLRAIEQPHSPARPARPQKIVVRDREIQFFLRGVLQNLEIAVDYEPKLPLIDELFRGLETIDRHKLLSIPFEYERQLREMAYQIWDSSPWELIADHDILAIKIDRWHVDTVYACVMGMLGREYGIVLYRSLDSLKYFRSVVLHQESVEQLEQAFLAQDCWFLNYESKNEEDLDDEDEEDLDLSILDISEIRPIFGSIHPYEGMRPLQDEEEALAVYVALKAIDKFVSKHSSKLEEEEIAEISDRFKITLPAILPKHTGDINKLESANLGFEVPKALESKKTTAKNNRQTTSKKQISVEISTVPEIAKELLSMTEKLGEVAGSKSDRLAIRDDLVPDDSIVSLGMISWDIAHSLENSCFPLEPPIDLSATTEGMPVIIIQTSRPKAKDLVNRISFDERGIKALCFNRGEDRFTDTIYDLGILQTEDNNMYIFGEFVKNDPKHAKARKQWNQRCQKSDGNCGVIIAMGITGVARGNPRRKDMLSLFAAKFVEPEELGIGVLQLMPQFDFDMDF